MLKVLDDTELDGEFARMLAERERQEELGQVKTGKVIAIQDNGLLVDVGEKLEGFLGLAEVADKDGKIPFNVGDEIVVFVSAGRW